MTRKDACGNLLFGLLCAAPTQAERRIFCHSPREVESEGVFAGLQPDGAAGLTSRLVTEVRVDNGGFMQSKQRSVVSCEIKCVLTVDRRFDVTPTEYARFAVVQNLSDVRSLLVAGGRRFEIIQFGYPGQRLFIAAPLNSWNDVHGMNRRHEFVVVGPARLSTGPADSQHLVFHLLLKRSIAGLSSQIVRLLRIADDVVDLEAIRVTLGVVTNTHEITDADGLHLFSYSAAMVVRELSVVGRLAILGVFDVNQSRLLLADTEECRNERNAVAAGRRRQFGQFGKRGQPIPKRTRQVAHPSRRNTARPPHQRADANAAFPEIAFDTIVRPKTVEKGRLILPCSAESKPNASSWFSLQEFLSGFGQAVFARRTRQ